MARQTGWLAGLRWAIAKDRYAWTADMDMDTSIFKIFQVYVLSSNNTQFENSLHPIKPYTFFWFNYLCTFVNNLEFLFLICMLASRVHNIYKGAFFIYIMNSCLHKLCNFY